MLGLKGGGRPKCWLVLLGESICCNALWLRDGLVCFGDLGDGSEVAACVVRGVWVFRQDTIKMQVAAIADVDEHCEVCHLRYHHKDVATPTDFGDDLNGACRQYKDNSCCTAVTAAKCARDLTPYPASVGVGMQRVVQVE